MGDWVPWVNGILVLLVAYFASRKDAAQEDQISKLWGKHDEDAHQLQELRIQIAANHYQKTELDAKFEKLERAFREEIQDIGKKLDRLTELCRSNGDDPTFLGRRT